ncbi:hypothetical protein SAMN02910447_01413 [Ruminococcus sp. YE71]|uniref:hypothetical protein n=1 Tax=unclassified Ruminococcus TaxID=2608920 RepID=UPI0008823087|nr:MULTISPECIES: hypothetical protein [unclassified Ruminococcus]SDA19089.1 hypothetical protein SAMN02910446_01561 [Ruminococcus sp. YE78]SFW28710.1 hypothetical protein SAMN02910447_01413 [Ruminococcus sp. YE71]
MILKKTAAILSAAVLLTACSKGSGGGNESRGLSPDSSKSSKDSSVRMNEKHAEFPESLKGLTKADVLRNVVFTTFDAASLIVEPEKQPFNGYKCTACFNGSYYIFKDDKGFGLLDQRGSELINSDRVKKITAVSPDMISVKYSDNTTKYFRTVNGGIKEEKVSFDKNRIAFEPLTGGEEDMYDTQHYVVTLDGNILYESKWIGYEETDLKSLDTSEDYETVYKAWNGRGLYYLAFDRFCNLTVCEAEYAKVELRIGEDYCECYITDPDEYDDLETLISSFGSEERTDAPGKASGSDYIRIEGGLAEGSRWVRTISPDGYCFTELAPDKSDAANAAFPDMYFTVMNPRTFTDLVSWTAGAVK